MPHYQGHIYVFDSALLDDQYYTINPQIEVAGTSDDAWEAVNQIAEAFVGTLLSTAGGVYRIGVHSADVINGNQNRDVTLPGTRVVTGDVLPAWNVVKVQFRAREGGRPSTFYLRPGLTTDDIVGQNFVTAFNDAAADFVAAAIAVVGFADPAGAQMISGNADPQVRMRQMGWHRRTRPGFKRGYVPV